MQEVKSKGMGPLAVTGIIIGGMVAVMVVLSMFGNSLPPEKVPQADLNDADALDKAYGSKANAWCDTKADNYLRQVTKYAFKWDEQGTFDMKFDRYMKNVPSPGVLVLATNKVAVQNGFGAYQRIELRCEYETQAEKVLGYQVMDQ